MEEERDRLRKKTEDRVKISQWLAVVLVEGRKRGKMWHRREGKTKQKLKEKKEMEM